MHLEQNVKDYRVPAEVQNSELRSNTIKSNITCLHDKASGMRTDMFHHQFEALLTQINGGEVPYLCSTMMHDILSKSTSIKFLEGELKVHAVFEYQQRKIYIYENNGTIDVFDTDGFFKTSKDTATRMMTDFGDLEVGETYNVGKENFLHSYPIPYDPVKGTVAIGTNLRTQYTTEVSTTLDSVRISEASLEKLASLRRKTLNITVKGVLHTPFGNELPEIGKILTSPILCSTIKEDSLVSRLTHTENMPIGEDSDMILVERNSYVSGYEVYCNQAIENSTVLENARLELLGFRNKVFTKLCELPKHKLTQNAKRYLENFSYTNIMYDNQNITKPLIRFHIVTISLPEIGTKISNTFGAKGTIQEITPTSVFKHKYDEYGRPIELILGGQSNIGRTISGPVWETYFTSLGDFLHLSCKTGKINKKVLKELLIALYTSVHQRELIDNLYNNMTEDEVFELWKEKQQTLTLKPYNVNVQVDFSNTEVYKLFKSHGYRKLHTIQFDKTVYPLAVYKTLKTNYELVEMDKVESYRDYMIEKDLDGLDLLNVTTSTVTRVRRKKSKTPDTIGYVYITRLVQDIISQSGVSGIPERGISGDITEKDDRRKMGRSILSVRHQKIDVQATSLLLNICNDNCLKTLYNSDNDIKHRIVEEINAVGLDVGFKFKNETDDDIEEDID